MAGMFQRGAGAAVIEGCDPSLALQDDVQDLFADNTVSGTRAAVLLDKAKKAGVKVLGKQMINKFGKNAARDMRRRMRRGDHWPDPYWLTARVWDRKLDKEVASRAVSCFLLSS